MFVCVSSVYTPSGGRIGLGPHRQLESKMNHEELPLVNHPPPLSWETAAGLVAVLSLLSLIPSLSRAERRRGLPGGSEVVGYRK